LKYSHVSNAVCTVLFVFSTLPHRERSVLIFILCLRGTPSRKPVNCKLFLVLQIDKNNDQCLFFVFNMRLMWEMVLGAYKEEFGSWFIIVRAVKPMDERGM
jgi:hypothetical protein